MKCPNCGSVEWYEGPGGGGSQNVQCAGCGNHYNLTPFGLDFIGVDRLPYIRNTHTGEKEEFPDLASAIREAKVRDEDIFRSADAPTLSECPHWTAHASKGTLMLDVIPAWRYFHPDRPLN